MTVLPKLPKKKENPKIVQLFGHYTITFLQVLLDQLKKVIIYLYVHVTLQKSFNLLQPLNLNNEYFYGYLASANNLLTMLVVWWAGVPLPSVAFEILWCCTYWVLRSHINTIKCTQSARHAGGFYFEGPDRNWILRVARAAPFSSHTCRQDGGATSGGGIGQRQGSPQHAENYQDPGGRWTDE